MREIKHPKNKDKLEYYIQGLIEQKYTLKEVANLTGYTTSHLCVLKKQYKERGKETFENGHKGMESKNKVPDDIKKKIIELYSEKYIGETFRSFSNVLKSKYNIDYSYRTIYTVLTSAGFSSPASHPHLETDTKKEDTIFQRRFKYLLEKLEISQTEIASKTNLSVSAISYYLSGRREPKGAILLTLANALETTPEYLLGKTDNEYKKHKNLEKEKFFELLKKLQFTEMEKLRIVEYLFANKSLENTELLNTNNSLFDSIYKLFKRKK